MISKIKFCRIIGIKTKTHVSIQKVLIAGISKKSNVILNRDNVTISLKLRNVPKSVDV